MFAHLLHDLGKVLGFFRNIRTKLEIKNLDGISENLIDLLIKYRQELKNKKLYQLADEIRKDLLQIGVQLKDTPDNTIWEWKN